MATTLGQMGIGSLVTIQESSGPAQFYVAYHNYKGGYSDNPDNMTLLVRKGHQQQTTLGVDVGRIGSGSSAYYTGYYWTDTNNYDLQTSYYNNVLTDTIKTKIPSVKYSAPSQSASSQEDGRSTFSALTGKIFCLNGSNLRSMSIVEYSTTDGYTTSNNSPAAEAIINSLINQIVTDATGVNINSGKPILLICGYVIGHPGGPMCWRNKESTSYSVKTPGVACVDIWRTGAYGTSVAGTPVYFLPCFLLPNDTKVNTDGSVYYGPLPVPSFSSLPNIGMQGQPITISWQASSEATGYILERKSNVDSDWTQVYTGANTIASETVGEWTSVQYRVKATNTDGESPYLTSTAIEVVTSQVLAISGTDGDLGTIVNDITYTVSTNTGNQIHLQRTVNGITFAELDVNSGFSYDIPVIDLPTGQGEIVITASTTTTGGQPYSTTRTWQYTKQGLTFSQDGAISQLDQNLMNIWPMTIQEAVKTYDFMGGTLDKTLIELYQGKSTIESGTYVGTGTYGRSNSNSIELPNAPKLLIVQDETNTKMYMPDTDTQTGDNVSVSKNNVSWYNDTSAEEQMNKSGVTYNWVAIY